MATYGGGPFVLVSAAIPFNDTRNKSAQEPILDSSGTILDPFWANLGPSLDRFESILDPFGSLWIHAFLAPCGTFWTNFGTVWTYFHSTYGPHDGPILGQYVGAFVCFLFWWYLPTDLPTIYMPSSCTNGLPPYTGNSTCFFVFSQDKYVFYVHPHRKPQITD